MSLVPSDQDHGGSRSRMEKTHLGVESGGDGQEEAGSVLKGI